MPGKVKTLREIYRLSASFGGQARAGRRQRRVGDHRTQPRHRRAHLRGCASIPRRAASSRCATWSSRTSAERSIRPTVEEQIHGGGAQGVGWAVYEEIVHDESGTPITASFMDYTVPKARQIPELEAVIVEVPSPIGPYGAKPVGEPPVIPGGAVIANAVHAAYGRAGDRLPLTPERVRRAMDQRANGHALNGTARV